MSLSPVDMHWAGDSSAWTYCSVEFAVLQVGVGCAFPFPEVCTPCCMWPCLAAKNLRCTALACPGPSPLLSQEAKTQTLHSASRLSPQPCLTAMLGGVLQSLCSAAFYTSWPGRLNGYEPCFQSGLFAGKAAAHVHGVPFQSRLHYLL